MPIRVCCINDSLVKYCIFADADKLEGYLVTRDNVCIYLTGTSLNDIIECVVLYRVVSCCVIVRRTEGRTLNRENPGSNSLAAVSKLWQVRSPDVTTVQSAV